MMHSFLREPLTLFALVALGLFALTAVLQPSSEQAAEPRQLVVDERALEAHLFLEELNNGEPLSRAQQDAATQGFIEEQVLVAEAYRLGLENDARVFALLAQKVLHVLSAAELQPNDETLSNYFALNAQQYAQPATFLLDEIVLGLNSTLELSEALETESELIRRLPRLSERDLASIFSASFAAQILDTADWTGPFVSNRGKHWLRVAQTTPAGVPAFDDIYERVRVDWITQQEERQQAARVEALVASYRIVRGAATRPSGANEVGDEGSEKSRGEAE